MKTSKLVGRTALFLLVVAAGSEFLMRGVSRISNRGFDLASPYVSSQRLIHGRNPYSSYDFVADWRASGGPGNIALDQSAVHPIYPPTALIVVSPLAALSWPATLRVYGWACTLGYIALVWLLAGAVGSGWNSARRLSFVAFALGLSSVHAGIAEGNLSMVAFLLCGYGLFLASRRCEIASGLLLGLALCIKPTSAIAAVAAVLLYGRIKAFFTTVGLSAAIAACSASAFAHINPVWKVDYLKNIALLFGPTGAASFTDPGGSYDLINLQVPIYVVSGSAKFANALAIAVTVGLAALWLLLFQRERRTGSGWNWLGVGSLLLIALLPVYQRNYNAEPILFAAIWAFANLHIRNAGTRVTLFIGLIFLVPGEGLLRNLGLPPHVWSNVLWNSLVMPQLTWAVLAALVASYLYRIKCIKLAEDANYTASSPSLT